MKRILTVLTVFTACLIFSPAHAKSYLCRTDGSIDAYDEGETQQIIKPLRQNEVEEMPLPAKEEPSEAPEPEKTQPRKRSTFVPLTMKDIEERSAAN